MKRIPVKTSFKKLLADVYTPVGIYLRLRDRFRDTILLESTDSHAGENSYSFIAINAIAGIEISHPALIEFKLPGQNAERVKMEKGEDVPSLLQAFMQRFEITEAARKPVNIAQGLFGYAAYDAVQLFDPAAEIHKDTVTRSGKIPLVRYRFYQYLIAIDHFKDELFICENHLPGIESETGLVESLIRSKDIPLFPFKPVGEEVANMSDTDYIEMVKKGMASCFRGDVFQVVLSRRFEQKFTGDEFNVYRALRSINPGPYLFYFDYGDYKLMGSSPESQLVVENGQATVHPIAGTVRRTGDDEEDKMLALQLKNDGKENAEHVMLVDLARNDLSRLCRDVVVSQFKKINYYSHVIHLVSEVTGRVEQKANSFKLLAATFPAGTLSGAPKIRAMQLIGLFEPAGRDYYGGAIGFIGFNGSINHAIMIRTFLSKENKLIYQAGAGVVAASVPANELQEVNNKLNALKKAIRSAEQIDS